MGAQFNFTVVSDDHTDGKPMNTTQLNEWFDEVVEDARYDHGHAGYTGTWAEAQGLSVRSEIFDSVEAASNWLESHAEKWGPALAVRVVAGPLKAWAVGAWCSS